MTAQPLSFNQTVHYCEFRTPLHFVHTNGDEFDGTITRILGYGLFLRVSAQRDGMTVDTEYCVDDLTAYPLN